MTQEPQKNNNIVLIVIAIIGVIGTIVATTIGVIGNYNIEKLRQDTELTRIALVSIATQGGATQASLASTISAPTETPINTIAPSTPTAITIQPSSTSISVSSTQPNEVINNSGSISFESPDSPETLNPLFQWVKGGSDASSYDLSKNSGALTIISGPKLNQYLSTQSAPLVLLPYSGDFQVQVKVIFHPVEVHQVAGLGVIVRNEKISYIRISRLLTDWGQGISFQSSSGNGNKFYYTGDETFFKISRHGSIFNIYYGFDGKNWVNLQKDYVFGFPDSVEIFLVTYSSSNNGVIAEFQDFFVESTSQ